jgi:hypothetical protein
MRALERIKQKQESMVSNPGERASPVQPMLTGEARALAKLKQRQLSSPLTLLCVVKDEFTPNSHHTHNNAKGEARAPNALRQRKGISDESNVTSFEGRTKQSDAAGRTKQRRSVTISCGLEGDMNRQSSHTRRSIEMKSARKTKKQRSRSAPFPRHVDQHGVYGPSESARLTDSGQVLRHSSRRSSTRRSVGTRSDKAERRGSQNRAAKAPRSSFSQHSTITSASEHERDVGPTALAHDRRGSSKRTSADSAEQAAIAMRHRRSSENLQSRSPPLRRSRSMGEAEDAPSKTSGREMNSDRHGRRRSSTASRLAKSACQMEQGAAATASTRRSLTRRSASGTTAHGGAMEDDFSVASSHSTQSRHYVMAATLQSALRQESESRFHSDWDSFSGSDGGSFAGDFDVDVKDSCIQGFLGRLANKEGVEPSKTGRLNCRGDDDMDKGSPWSDDDSFSSFVSSRSEKNRTYDPARDSALVVRSRTGSASKSGVRRSGASSLLPLPAALESRRAASLAARAPGKIASRASSFGESASVAALRDSVRNANDTRRQSLGRRGKDEPSEDPSSRIRRASSSNRTTRRARSRPPPRSAGSVLGQASTDHLKASSVHTSSPSGYSSGLLRPAPVDRLDR